MIGRFDQAHYLCFFFITTGNKFASKNTNFKQFYLELMNELRI